jgi:hypothetical protein
MAKYDNPLRHVKVAAPCSADWDYMIGDNRTRFCNQCNLNVYNLSGMSKTEAEDLIRRSEGRLCVRFYRRSDGTILTENCPVGLAAIKRRVSRIATAALSAVLSFFAGLGLQTALYGREAAPDRRYVMGAVAVTAVEPQKNEEQNWTMGKFAMQVDENKEKVKSRPLPVMGRIAVMEPRKGEEVDKGGLQKAE